MSFGTIVTLFGVDSAQMGILKKSDEVDIAGFLKSYYNRNLETEVGFEVSSYIMDQTMERKLPYE